MTDPHLTPHWATSALITIDVQRDFLSESPYGVPGTTEVLPPGAPPLDPELLLSGEPQPLGEREVALFKPRWGAFYRTRLDDLLRGWGVDTLVVAGCNFPNCPRATLVEGSERDYRLVLADDAVSRLHDIGRTEMTGIGVNLLPVKEITTALPATSG
jgi:nicotinamidase-related amidase